MNTCVNLQWINIWEQRSLKIIPQTFLLRIIKIITICQILKCRFRNMKFHLTLFCNCCFAISQFINLSVPFFIFPSLSFRTSSCQAGEGKSDELWHISSQIVSIAISFSCKLISLSGSVANINTSWLSLKNNLSFLSPISLRQLTGCQLNRHPTDFHQFSKRGGCLTPVSNRLNKGRRTVLLPLVLTHEIQLLKTGPAIAFQLTKIIELQNPTFHKNL